MMSQAQATARKSHRRQRKLKAHILHKHAHEMQSTTAHNRCCKFGGHWGTWKTYCKPNSKVTGLLPSQRPPGAARVVIGWHWSLGRLYRTPSLQTKWKPVHNKGCVLHLAAQLLHILFPCSFSSGLSQSTFASYPLLHCYPLGPAT